MAVDRKAVAGVQPDDLERLARLLMPNTSGLNARVPLKDLTAHLRARVRARRLSTTNSAPPMTSASASANGARRSVPVAGSEPAAVDTCSSASSLAVGVGVESVVGGAAAVSVASSDALDTGAGPSS